MTRDFQPWKDMERIFVACCDTLGELDTGTGGVYSESSDDDSDFVYSDDETSSDSDVFPCIIRICHVQQT